MKIITLIFKCQKCPSRCPFRDKSVIVEQHLEARLAVVKEAAVASDENNKSAVLCLRLASLQ